MSPMIFEFYYEVSMKMVEYWLVIARMWKRYADE